MENLCKPAFSQPMTKVVQSENAYHNPRKIYKKDKEDGISKNYERMNWDFMQNYKICRQCNLHYILLRFGITWADSRFVW